MKKILALIFSLMMLFSVSAMAEEESNVLNFNEAVMAELPGEFVLLEEFGMMFYLPSSMQQIELTEADIANGGYAGWTDGAAGGISIGCRPSADAEGNPITDYETLCAFYNESGLTSKMVTLNEIPCVTFSTEDASLFGVSYLLSDGSVLAFTFTGVVENTVVLSSIMLALME